MECLKTQLVCTYLYDYELVLNVDVSSEFPIDENFVAPYGEGCSYQFDGR